MNRFKCVREGVIIFQVSVVSVPRFHLNSCTCTQTLDGHVSSFTLPPPISCHSICLCLYLSAPQCARFFFSACLIVYFSGFLPTYLSLSFNCLAQYLFVFMQSPSLTWDTVCSCYGCGSCLLGHQRVEPFYPECVMCIVYSLMEPFNAPWQPDQVIAGSVSYH